ncbi:MAG TPA: serine protease, partial [Salinimicrobium sp.]|nr:serine protease [Salinimicrobium sp.]
ELDLKRNQIENGVVITRGLTPQMQAENLKGIIITEIDNIPVYNIDDVEEIMSNKDYNDPISVTFVTPGGNTQTFVWR